jgi:transposase-like protein
MKDSQQRQLVHQLEQQADEAQLARNMAKDQFDVALHKAQQPNRYRWQQHGAVWLFAGVVGTGGTLYAVVGKAPLMLPLTSGAAVGAGLLSNTVDQRRQTAEKQSRLTRSRYNLSDAERLLHQTVLQYREEEELGWLMYALDTQKEKLLALRSWMGDPRRTMKDSVLEAVDIVTATFLQQPLETAASSPLAAERGYRQLRQRLFSETITLKKDAFLANVFAKHHLLREQELQRAGVTADWLINSTAVSTGSSVGLLAGAGLTALGTKAALGTSPLAMAHGLTGIASVATVVGVGLLTASTVHQWLNQAQAQRRQQEAQQFHDAFERVNQVLENVLEAQQAKTIAAQHQRLQSALKELNALKKEALKSQDSQMKRYVGILGERLQQAVQATAPETGLNFRKRLLNKLL